MKKRLRFVTTLVAASLLAGLFWTVSFAQSNNWLRAGDSDFESGSTAWKAFGAGTAEVTDNPSGSGKVLKFSGAEGKSWASAALDIRGIVQANAKKASKIKISMDIYTQTQQNPYLTVRTQDQSLSIAAAAGNTYPRIGTVKTVPGEWTRLEGEFTVTDADLKNTGTWTLCLDNLAAYADVYYIDNVTITGEELQDNTQNPGGDAGQGQNPGGDVSAAGAATENLLENPSFADGFGDPWKSYGSSSVMEAEEGAQDDDGIGLLITDRTKNFSSIIYNNIHEIVYEYGPGRYQFSCWAKLADASAAAESLNFVIYTKYKERPAEEKGDYHVGGASINANTWTKITYTWNFPDVSDNFLNSYLYLIMGNENFHDFYVDNFSMVRLNPVIPPEPVAPLSTAVPEKEAARPAALQIGTIRWDAYTQSTYDGTDPASQVARCLSPAQYHWTAPFFSQVDAQGRISFPEYTTALWEQEAQYAADAGLNYFAYLWYESDSAMSQPRKAHLASEKKNLIKMCGILETIRGKAAMQELYAAMQEDCYLTVDGMPVLFIYDGLDWLAEDLETIRRQAATAGVENPLYMIAMGSDSTKIQAASIRGYDAFSWYGVAATKMDMSYQELTEAADARLEAFAKAAVAREAQGSIYQIVPSFTAGRDGRSRIETGVSWVEGDPKDPNNLPYGGAFAVSGTAEEIAAHAGEFMQWTLENEKITQPNLLISYGWNEHDEGGWLCPTLACDEEGNVLKDENGNNLVNTDRLDALKKEIDAFRAKENAAVKPTDILNNQGDISGIQWWMIALPAAGIVLAGGTAAIVIIKKKKGASGASADPPANSNE